jgi:uncharacterized membrane protein YfcA
VFTALFGLRTAVPTLTLTQLASNGSRVWLNRRHLQWPIIGRFALGAVPFALAGGLLLAVAPLAPLKRVLGVFLLAVVVWRRVRPAPPKPSPRAFVAVGAASGLGSALLGLVLTPATLAGAWAGKRTVDRISDRVFVLLVEAGLVVAGVLFLFGR